MTTTTTTTSHNIDISSRKAMNKQLTKPFLNVQVRHHSWLGDVGSSWLWTIGSSAGAVVTGRHQLAMLPFETLEGHPKWRWLLGNAPNNGLKSGWGFIINCPDISMLLHISWVKVMSSPRLKQVAGVISKRKSSGSSGGCQQTVNISKQTNQPNKQTNNQPTKPTKPTNQLTQQTIQYVQYHCRDTFWGRSKSWRYL